jgi:hypothetical protein
MKSSTVNGRRTRDHKLGMPNTLSDFREVLRALQKEYTKELNPGGERVL